MIDLLTALDDLTQPVNRKIIQETPDGPEPTSVVRIIDPSLLDQLDNSIRANMGGSTKGGSDPATRSLVDAAALMRSMQISGEVSDWARAAGAIIDKGSISNTLRAWHGKFIGRATQEDRMQYYTRRLVKWAAQITATLDPPREKDLDCACPDCGAIEWWNSSNGERFTRPLIIRYRPDSPTMVEDARASCRGCGESWGVRDLQRRIELDVGESIDLFE